MSEDRIWAHCPTCKHTQRFQRVEVNHAVHAVLTVCTLGLWGVSWPAITMGRAIKPWRCKQCEGSDNGKPRVRRESDAPKDDHTHPAG